MQGAADPKGLTKLSELNLYFTQVTDDGLEGLRQSLPGAKIGR